jgi:hypothetical protein
MNFNKVKSQTKKIPRYRTHCKVCRSAIVEGQAVVWQTKPMGLSHKECV